MPNLSVILNIQQHLKETSRLKSDKKLFQTPSELDCTKNCGCGLIFEWVVFLVPLHPDDLTLLSPICLVSGSRLIWSRLCKYTSFWPIRVFTRAHWSCHWSLCVVMWSSCRSRASTPCCVLSHWLRTFSTGHRAQTRNPSFQIISICLFLCVN